MAASFGEQLRAAREAQGITLREVSEQTRISLRYLEALEANDFKPLPGGVFNRSFIKTYAKYIGFDENEALRLYRLETNDQGAPEEAPVLQTHAKVYTDDNLAGSPLTTFLLVVVALGLLAAGVYGFVRWYNRSGPTPVAPAPPPTPAQMATAATPQPAASGTPATPAGTPDASGTPNAGGTPGAPPAPPAGGFAIQVRAKEKPVRVATAVDGAKLESVILKPGETRDFTPQSSLAVEYTEPGGTLMEIFVNGQPIVMPLEGKLSGKYKIISFVLSRDSYQSMLAGAAPAATPTP